MKVHEGRFYPYPLTPLPVRGRGVLPPSLTPQKPNLHPSLLSLRFHIKLALRYILATRPFSAGYIKGA